MIKKLKSEKDIFEDSSFEGPEGEKLCWNKFREGDKNAYLYIYNKYSNLLFRYGRKIVQDREVVKDAIHDLFVELWKNKHNLGEAASIKNYLLKSLRRKLIRTLKKNIVITGEDRLDDYKKEFVLSRENDIILSEMSDEQKERLTLALNKLTPRQKEIVFLLFYDDCPPKEIASIMSLQIRTVYNTVHNAIQVLKKHFSILAVIFIFL